MKNNFTLSDELNIYKKYLQYFKNYLDKVKEDEVNNNVKSNEKPLVRVRKKEYK